METSCYEGFGLVDASGSFVSNRTTAVGCGLCQAGTASEELIDDVGRTFQCKPCPPGYSQPNTYSTQCEPCPTGTSASMYGSTRCTPCNEGDYQPDAAQTSCIPCGASRTTLLLGASSLADCVCQEGKIEKLSTCMECDEQSMHCPRGSTIEKLEAADGTTDLKIPFVKKGFFSKLHLLQPVLGSITFSYRMRLSLLLCSCFVASKAIQKSLLTPTDALRSSFAPVAPQVFALETAKA